MFWVMTGKTREANFGGGCLSQNFVSVMRDAASPCRLHEIGNYIALNTGTHNRPPVQEDGLCTDNFGFELIFFWTQSIGE